MGGRQLPYGDRMIGITTTYLEGVVDLREFKGGLEDNFNIAEIKDRDLGKEFWQLWCPFEEAYACNIEMGTEIDEQRLKEDAEKMKTFLLQNRMRVAEYDPWKL